jgi:hypothetical protein
LALFGALPARAPLSKCLRQNCCIIFFAKNKEVTTKESIRKIGRRLHRANAGRGRQASRGEQPKGPVPHGEPNTTRRRRNESIETVCSTGMCLCDGRAVCSGARTAALSQ